MVRNGQDKLHSERMKRALRLARKARGKTSPNPIVGALVVKNGRIVGEGYHVFDRIHHAEVEALNRAGLLAQGSDMYVTLEPCHHHGRTPPCVDRIAESGVKKVYVAIRDPNPDVSGGGIEALREKGIEVICDVCKEEARDLNEVFFHFVTHQRPFVILKLALSLDGRIATHCGSSKWITGEKARHQVHRMRYESEAILVGINTVLQDNPSLDVRWKKQNSITKVILDTHLRTPIDSRIFDSGDTVLIFHGKRVDSARKEKLVGRACLIEIEDNISGLDWSSVLDNLGKRKLQSLLVEGGGQIAGSLVKSGMINRLVLFFGPKVIGHDGLPGFILNGIDDLSEVPQMKIRRIRRIDPDFIIEADPVT